MPGVQQERTTARRLDACFLALLFGAPIVDAMELLIGARYTPLDGGVLLLAIVSLVCWLVGRRSRGRGSWLLGGTLTLSLAYFLALRYLPFVVFGAVFGLIWLVASLTLFARRIRWASLTALCVAIGGMGIALGEASLALVERWNPHEREQIEGRLIGPDPELSGIPQPNAAIHHKRMGFNVVYHTEPDHSRVVPGRPAMGRRWVLFGGSFAFGWGIPDDQTIAAHLQRQSSPARVFNFAVSGYGTADVYLLLRRILRNPPDTRLCVYFLMSDHLRRTACPDSLTAAPWGPRKPRFALNEGHLTLLGHATETLGLAGRLNVQLLRKSRLYRACYPRWRPAPGDAELLENLILSMKRSCDQASGCRFVVVNLPVRKTDREQGDMLAAKELARVLPELAARGVAILDCAPKFAEHIEATGTHEDDYYFADRHPNERYASLVAGWLHDYLIAADVGGGL